MMSQQEDIGKAIVDLKSLYPDKSACERADIVFGYISQHGVPPLVVTFANGNGGGGK